MKDDKCYEKLGATVACAIQAAEGTIQVKEVQAALIEETQFGSARAVAAVAKRDADAVY